ncbi:hypothetical protein [Campylobacter armoricus]|uniref:Scaffolding protein n=1 Tax=Campylobacter armoricus TaxID=2505970 RepID=A0A7L5HK05_9BACT|nr:hypothetical protein [Campylobacter armoricus]QKF79555.1 hypothetical protein CARM_0637 [Campylobacter armoricus]
MSKEIQDLLDALNDDGVSGDANDTNNTNDDNGNANANTSDTNNSKIEEEFKILFQKQEEKIRSLEQALSEFKKPNETEEENQRKEYLKQLGLDNIDEKLKKLEELESKAKQKEEEESLRNKYMQVEAQLRKDYPQADLKAMSELANKLSGLANGDLQSWNTLLRIFYSKTNEKKADDMPPNQSKNDYSDSDFAQKVKQGKEVSNIDLGKEILSLM